MTDVASTSTTAIVSNAPSADARALIAGSPYQQYVYGYPHKLAYRRFESPPPLSELWADEDQRALFLYAHIPFCEHRCGFCNLFTQSQPEAGLARRYLAQLGEEARRVRDAIPQARFARIAVGGGTPTHLDVEELGALFDILERTLGDGAERTREAGGALPVSFEASPATADEPRLALLRARGVERLSLGVQSFDDEDAARMGRPQRAADVARALSAIRAAGFPTLNIDLIYGGEGQTPSRFLKSLEAALQWRPEEIYLYPLYVRPLTGLGRKRRAFDDQRLSSYRAGRERLLGDGYEQLSMRMFRRLDAPAAGGPVYCCQEDGMVGLGCGARSYTREVHYSSEFAVSQGGVRRLIAEYLARESASFSAAHFGIHLPLDDQRRRDVAQSLLQVEGLDRARYRRRFGTDALDDLPQLSSLVEAALATLDDQRLRLTPLGLERSDAAGPWLFSERVARLIADAETE